VLLLLRQDWIPRKMQIYERKMQIYERKKSEELSYMSLLSIARRIVFLLSLVSPPSPSPSSTSSDDRGASSSPGLFRWQSPSWLLLAAFRHCILENTLIKRSSYVQYSRILGGMEKVPT